MDKIKIREAILVEGKYDKNTVSQIIDTTIIETNGFRIFHDAEKLSMLRRIAEVKGLLVFTDSDGAGFVIRNKIKSVIPAQFLKHAYIPDIYGREKRKRIPGKEGKLGVEGMSPQIIIKAIQNAGVIIDDAALVHSAEISRADIYELGLSGSANSAARRALLKKRLGLPEHLSPTALFQVIAATLSKNELYEIMKSIGEENG